MNDGLSAGGQQLRDQPAMAAPPDGLGAHEARRGLRKGGCERRLPLGRPHTGGVAAEGGDPQAAEPALAGLTASPPAELDGVPVRDACVLHRCLKRRLVELRVAPGAGEAADVDERPNTGTTQRLDELVERPYAVTDRENGHVPTHRITPSWYLRAGDGRIGDVDAVAGARWLPHQQGMRDQPLSEPRSLGGADGRRRTDADERRARRGREDRPDRVGARRACRAEGGLPPNHTVVRRRLRA